MLDWLGKMLQLPECFLAGTDGQGGGVIQVSHSPCVINVQSNVSLLQQWHLHFCINTYFNQPLGVIWRKHTVKPPSVPELTLLVICDLLICCHFLFSFVFKSRWQNIGRKLLFIIRPQTDSDDANVWLKAKSIHLSVIDVCVRVQGHDPAL